MAVTTKRRSKSPEKAEKAAKKSAMIREMALMLSTELEAAAKPTAKPTERIQRLKRAPQEVKGIDRYSELNQLLILEQCPHVTEVHGYKEWQSLGYQVREGEESIWIRAPHEIKKKGDEKKGDEAKKGKVGFHPAFLFDRSQVDPIDEARKRAKAPYDVDAAEEQELKDYAAGTPEAADAEEDQPEAAQEAGEEEEEGAAAEVE